MQKSTPTPIFNHRKRPRQAIFADVQNVMPVQNEPTNTCKYPDLMPVNGFSTKQPLGTVKDLMPVNGFSTKQPLGSEQQHTSLSMKCQTASKTVNNIQTKNLTGQSTRLPSNFRHFSNQQISNAFGNPVSNSSSSNNYTNVQQSSYENKRQSHAFGPSQPYSHSTMNGGASYINDNNIDRNNASYFHENTPITGAHRGQIINTTGNLVNQARNQTSAAATKSWSKKAETQISRRDDGIRRNIQKHAVGDISPNTFSSQKQYQFAPSQSYAALDIPDQNIHCHGDAPIVTTRNKEFKSVASKGTEGNCKDKPAATSTLHIVTTDLQGLKHWSKFKQHIPMLFEVFAFLDSGIRSSAPESSKLFQLRDGTSQTIDCIYYEIDRTLPSLTRGLWNRCVGSWNEKKKMFHILSIRSTSEQEKRFAWLKKRASEKCLIQLTKSINEQ